MKNKLQRHLTILGVLFLSAIFLSPAIEEIKTFFLIIITELVALMLSAFTAWSFTRLDFTKDNTSVLGHIFLGVHLCTGLTVLGVYIA